MQVTIIADASHCPTTGVAGYGYWIACERGKRPGGGPIKTTVTNPNVAEMMALVRALFDGLKFGLIKKGDQVCMQSDCQTALEYFKRRAPSVRSNEERVYEVFKRLQTRYELIILFLHVKGHTSSSNPKYTAGRYAANRHCDQRAKDAMRALRKEKYPNWRPRYTPIEKAIEAKRKTERSAMLSHALATGRFEDGDEIDEEFEHEVGQATEHLHHNGWGK